MVNNALKQNWGFANANRILSQQKALTFRLGALLLPGGCPIRQLVLYQKNCGWMDFLGIEHRSIGVVLAEGPCDLRLITSAEGLRDGEADSAPFELYPGICLATEEKHGRRQTVYPSSHSTARCAHLVSFEGEPRLACCTSVHLGYPGDFNKPSVGTGAFQLPDQGVTRIS
jgi:hypothetical protein